MISNMVLVVRKGALRFLETAHLLGVSLHNHLKGLQRILWKKRKYPVSGISLGKNTLLISEVI